jgi:hypothetical protein
VPPKKKNERQTIITIHHKSFVNVLSVSVYLTVLCTPFLLATGARNHREGANAQGSAVFARPPLHAFGSPFLSPHTESSMVLNPELSESAVGHRLLQVLYLTPWPFTRLAPLDCVPSKSKHCSPYPATSASDYIWKKGPLEK